MSLSVPDLKNKTDWKRSEGVVLVVAAGCGLDLPGNSGVAGHGRRFILSGEAGEASGEARCHTRGREGGSDVTSRSVRGRGGGLGPDWD